MECTSGLLVAWATEAESHLAREFGVEFALEIALNDRLDHVQHG